MSTAIFNRKDASVKKDAIALSEEQFVEKYSNTTASAETLASVYKSFGKDRKAQQTVVNTAEEAADLPKAKGKKVSSYVSEDGDLVETKKIGATTAVEVTTAKGKEVKGSKTQGEEKAEKPEGAAKAGRTPRMRELIKELGKDKQLVKKALVDEGFDCSGSGFHSEWNRVSKA